MTREGTNGSTSKKKMIESMGGGEKEIERKRGGEGGNVTSSM